MNSGPAHTPTPGTDQPSDLVRRWTSAIITTCHVPMSRAEVQEQLTEFAARLSDALAAGTPEEAEAVGADLVAAHVVGPEAVGVTTTLVGSHLLRNSGLPDTTENRDLVAALCGRLCVGSVTAMRERLFAEQELIKKAVLRAREESQRALTASEAQFKVLFDTTAIGIGVGNLAGWVVNANPAMLRTLQYALHELREHRIQDLLHPADRAHMFPLLDELRRGQRDTFSSQARLIDRHGDEVWTNISLSLVRDASGTPQYPVAMVENRSYTHLLQDELQRQSVSDSLTGVANKLKFESQLQSVLANARPSDVVSLSFWDIDGFKVINDGFSRQVGDEMLKLVANKLIAVFGPHAGLVARVAGDGFAVLLAAAPTGITVTGLIERAQEELAEPYYGHGVEGAAISMSVGLVEEPGGTVTAEELVRRAEITLHRAKAAGKAQWMRAEPAQDRQDRQRFRMGALMPAALENGEFVVEYEPVVQLTDRTLVGVHAVTCWDSPEFGRLDGAEFVELAEEMGLIAPLGRYVLDEVAREVARLRTLHGEDVPVFLVRLVPRMGRDQYLVRDVKAACERHDIPGSQLQISVPASALRSEDDDAVEALRTLSWNTVRIGADGVGAGGLDMAGVPDLPIRDVALGPTLVGRLLAGGNGAAKIFADGVRGMITIAHVLGYTVTSGALDSAENVTTMLELGVDYGYGEAIGARGPRFDLAGWSGR